MLAYRAVLERYGGDPASVLHEVIEFAKPFRTGGTPHTAP